MKMKMKNKLTKEQYSNFTNELINVFCKYNIDIIKLHLDNNYFPTKEKLSKKEQKYQTMVDESGLKSDYYYITEHGIWCKIGKCKKGQFTIEYLEDK
jgi:hypothetical protein